MWLTPKDSLNKRHSKEKRTRKDYQITLFYHRDIFLLIDSFFVTTRILVCGVLTMPWKNATKKKLALHLRIMSGFTRESQLELQQNFPLNLVPLSFSFISEGNFILHYFF